MRRRRKHLEVSTFPFLAVLLCTMGSLILVLLVMDRRAKLAARQKAEAEVARVVGERRRQVEERRAALRRKKEETLAAAERQRQALHERLLADDKDVEEQIRLLSLRLAEAAKAVSDGNDRLANLRKQVEAERVRAIELEQALKHDQDAAAASAATDTDAAKAAVRTAIAEVARLQSQLEELKAARGRKEHTYSVVPFRGSHGDDRRPLYVECASRCVVFHPDRKELPLPLHIAGVRAEVDRHVARTTDGVRRAATDDTRPAYCLLLVRPAGIEAYYEMQTVLRGLGVDYGYEFIDANWLLDFPEDDKSPSRPWTAGANDGPGLPPTPSANGPRMPGLAPLPSRTEISPPAFSGPVASGDARPGPGTAPGPAGSTAGLRSEGVRGYRFSDGNPAREGVGGGTGMARNDGLNLFPGFSGWPSARGTDQPPGRNVAPGSVDGAFNSGTAQRGNAEKPDERGVSDGPAGPGNTGLGRPGAQGTPGTPPSPGTAAGPPAASGSGRPGAPGQAPGEVPVSGPNADRTPTTTNTGQSPQGGGQQSPGPRKPGDPAASPGVPGDSQRNISAADGSSPGAPSTTGASQSPGGSSGSSIPRVPLPTDRFRPAPKAGDDREPIARRPARLSDRDWIIYIECESDRVILYPARLEFSRDAVTAPLATNTLLATVRKMIERRQAALAPGEVPYRPEIRFLLRPNSLRMFHATYPVFDALPVPKTRQTLAAEDDVRSVMQ
jgi:hypothetical protein